jgi:hypothetical protein
MNFDHTKPDAQLTAAELDARKARMAATRAQILADQASGAKRGKNAPRGKDVYPRGK